MEENFIIELTESIHDRHYSIRFNEIQEKILEKMKIVRAERPDTCEWGLRDFGR